MLLEHLVAAFKELRADARILLPIIALTLQLVTAHFLLAKQQLLVYLTNIFKDRACFFKLGSPTIIFGYFSVLLLLKIKAPL